MANSTADTPDVSETKLAKMRIKDLREHARERGIEGADDLHKPELLLMVKDWHYARAHGGQHRPDAPAAARNGHRTAKGSDGKKADAKKAESRKADEKKSASKKADAKKSEARKAEPKKSEGKGGDRADARRAVADIRRRLAQIEDVLADLEADLR